MTIIATQGTKMRRLRSRINSYQKLANCETIAYQVGTDAAIDQNIVNLIDEWCSMKGSEAPFIPTLKQDILNASLRPIHRLFLIKSEVLQLDAVILLSPTGASLNGYLMDLEFYRQDLPTGCLEYGISEIMRLLLETGSRYFSLGVTFGTQLNEHENADPNVAKLFSSLHANKMLNGDGNFQFKSKFRAEVSTTFLCRPKDSPASNLTELLLMIAAPAEKK